VAVSLAGSLRAMPVRSACHVAVRLSLAPEALRAAWECAGVQQRAVLASERLRAALEQA